MGQSTVDNAIVDPDIYATAGAYEAVFGPLRRNDPVHWTEPKGYRPFWTISRYDDVAEIERRADEFLNAPRMLAIPIAVEESRARQGRARPVHNLVSMDGQEHRLYRTIAQAYFSPANVRRLELQLADLARLQVDRMLQHGRACDFVADVAVWYPLRVIMMLLGVEPEHEPLMLRLTQELFAPTDPDLARKDADAGSTLGALTEMFAFFQSITDDRRARPRDDLASMIANASIEGRRIEDHEALSYYLLIATAGHDTTSSSIAGGLLALLENPRELQRLRQQPELLAGAIDEMIRWVTPVKHFFRTAKDDVEFRGRRIRAGDALMMCYWSANRDEEVFGAGHEFQIDRGPNRHLAFGFGPHVCIGQHLAKAEMRAIFTELLTRVDAIELDGEPAWVRNSFVSGLKRLPIRYRAQPV